MPDQQDVPLATVVGPSGLSEATLLITAVLGWLLTAFGDKAGIDPQAVDVAPLAATLAAVGMAVARAIKHHGVTRANATVIAQQQAGVPVQTDNSVRDVDGPQDVEQDGALDYSGLG